MRARPESDELNHRSSTLHLSRAHRLRSSWRSFDDEPHLIARMPDHALWMTFFRDPDRNLHGLMAEVR